jgi:hypothetical protein
MKLSKYADLLRAAFIALIMAAGIGTLTACDEGGFEEAGEEIDDAADDIEDEL